MNRYAVATMVVVLCHVALAQDARSALAEVVAQLHHAGGGPVYSLEQLESVALRDNPQIRVAAEELKLSDAGISEAGALEDPWLMYRGWGVPFSEPWNLNRSQQMFMISQTVPGRGKRGLRSQIAAQDVSTDKARLESVQQQVLAQVRTDYYELLRTADELRLHEVHTSLAAQALESARIKYVVGKVPQQDVLKAQVAASKLLEHLVMFAEQGELARADLNTLMGRSPDAPLEVSGEYHLPLKLPSLADLQVLAMAHMPELKSAESQVRREELNLDLARKAYSPDFTVAGGYMLMGDDTKDRNRYMVELSMNLPWVNRRKHDSAIAQAEAGESLRRAELESRRSLVMNRIQQALVRVKASRELAQLYRDTLRPQAESTFRSATVAYQSDRTDFLNLLEAQNALIEIELSYYRALSEFDQRFAELELAVGAPIDRGPAVQRSTTSEVRP